MFKKIIPLLVGGLMLAVPFASAAENGLLHGKKSTSDYWDALQLDDSGNLKVSCDGGCAGDNPTFNSVTVNGTGVNIQGDNASIDFDSPTDGTTRFCSDNNTNDECLDLDLETTADQAEFKSTTGVTKLKFGDSLVSGNSLVGSVVAKTWDLNSAIVSFYKMEENAANTTVGDEQSANAGTSSTNTSNLTTTGKLGNAFHIDASSSELVDLGSDSSLKFTGDFSVEFWINHANNSQNRYPVGNRALAGNNAGFEFVLLASDVVRLQIDDDTAVAQIDSTTVVCDGTWHHVVAGLTSSTPFMYIDGASEGTASGTLSGDWGTNAENMQIGVTPLREGTAGNHMNGDIDNVRFYNRALTATEITNLYNAGTGTELLADASGVNVSDGNVYVDPGTGIGGIYLDGSGGGCLMIRDTDDAGFSECTLLNGTMSCGTDADGVCDGTA